MSKIPRSLTTRIEIICVALNEMDLRGSDGTRIVSPAVFITQTTPTSRPYRLIDGNFLPDVHQHGLCH
ncbi:hypothetical protein KQX54_015331 [Cotesia glomerata]|uniref:Uncharacterized protein n=1 Tax=Cotesia glomerata TaxID=32391 RepID=A0AAV7IEB2_COTGL|nr:hypothetical protein KQX54_015331 [Cotesia glomerata]